MRILHTSDWHLGQSFFNKSRRAEHQAFLRWLLDRVTEQQINAVIVAGDIFDTGTPPSYAREMYNQFVVDLNQLGCALVVLGGNHDSVATLNESKPLLNCLNTYVVANTSDDLDQQLIPLKNSDGSVGAILCAVPFIRPRDVMQSMAGDAGVDKQKQLGEAIKQHYQRLYDNALQLRQEQSLNVPIIATGHLTAMGVTRADSERDIYIGTLDAFAADGFPPADYIALGHIHRPQIVAKSEHIRYSGSPIPLSFDELKSNKQVVMVTFDQQQKREITPIDVPLFQPMHWLSGDLAKIEAQLQQLFLNEKEAVAEEGQDCEEDKPVWLGIEVAVQDFLSDLQQRIQTMTQDLNVEVLQLRRARGRVQASLQTEKIETLAELSPFDVFEKRLEQEALGEEDDNRTARLTTLFKQIVEQVQSGEEVEE